MNLFFRILLFLNIISIYSQNNQITIDAELYAKENIINIHQKLTYYNNSNDTLQKLVLRNWANSYKNNKTPLAKRLLEDYRTSFYFAKNKDRGYSEIKSIQHHTVELTHNQPNNLQDLISVDLNKKLTPGDSIQISLDYQVKIPNAKFTGNGKKGVDYYLNEWHITPAPYEEKWVLDTHQNLDYQYNTPTDYNINFKVPVGYQIQSAFEQQKTKSFDFINYQLTGKNIVKSNLSISFLKSYSSVKTNKNIHIITDFISEDIDHQIQEEKIKQMIDFLEKNIGKSNQNKILVDKENYKKSPIYELKYLPEFLHPYKSDFKWEIKFFKTLSLSYIDQILKHNQKKYYSFNKGLEVYLFIKYLDQFYPEAKITGRLSNVWGIRSMNISKSKFTDKFSIQHQITARENLDQSLNTELKDYANYNKKLITPYKSGLGFIFLENYIGKDILQKSITDFISQNNNTGNPYELFLQILQTKSNKNLSWYQTEWINSNKKIDHTIKKAFFEIDSVYITLKNKRSIKTPVSIYGLRDGKIIEKKWVDGFSDIKETAIKNDNLDKVVLNYNHDYTEINNRNNWKNSKSIFFERPLKIKLFQDLNNPNTNQIFLNPEFDYNTYDGAILTLSIKNKAFISKNFEYSLRPSYSTASGALTGGFGFDYTVFPEKTNVYDINLGINGSNYHYTDNLKYNVISPYFSIGFKPNDMRAIGTNKITARFLAIDKEVESGIKKTDEDQYQLLKIAYDYRKNELIDDYKLNVKTEIASKFTKLTTDFRYRHLTNKKRPIEFRFFGGVFLSNNTNSDYFSYNQHTANDYLFELPYLGRSETSGLLSQQFIRAEGGFISQNEPGFANQWLTSINTSIGIVRWVEAYNNISLLKNTGNSSFLDYEGGIRLNFITDILEIHLPIYNKEGFTLQNDGYFNNIRFSLILDGKSLFKFFKQQIF